MKYLSYFAWLAVTVSGLDLSLFIVGRHFGIPVVLAAVLVISFDGAALVITVISLWHARIIESVRACGIGLAKRYGHNRSKGATVP